VAVISCVMRHRAPFGIVETDDNVARVDQGFPESSILKETHSC